MHVRGENSNMANLGLACTTVSSRKFGASLYNTMSSRKIKDRLYDRMNSRKFKARL